MSQKNVLRLDISYARFSNELKNGKVWNKCYLEAPKSATDFDVCFFCCCNKKTLRLITIDNAGDMSSLMWFHFCGCEMQILEPFLCATRAYLSVMRVIRTDSIKHWDDRKCCCGFTGSLITHLEKRKLTFIQPNGCKVLSDSHMIRNRIINNHVGLWSRKI